MKAIVYSRYGPPDVLQMKELEIPVPQDNEVLVKIRATTVNRTDNATIRGIPFFARIVTGVVRPKKSTPGTELAGDIVAVGKQVTSLKVGDRVFGFNDNGSESHAEYTTIAEDKVVTIPQGVSYEQAAASSEGSHYAYNFINKVPLKQGDQVLVNGASGAIGSAAVQLLRYFGAEVTAVCSTRNVELVRSLGADRVIDYSKQDFTQDDHRYHYVFDTVGKSSFFKCRRLLLPGGAYISSDLGFLSQNIFLPMITPVIKSLIGNKITIFPFPVDVRGSLLLVRKMIEQGKFKAVIDRTYPLEEIFDAYQYVGKGHKTGNVVIAVGNGNA